MKFAIIKEHRDFFEKNGWIEFSDLVRPIQLNQINQAIDQALAEKLEIGPKKLEQLTSEQLFLQGRDLWRISDQLRKFISQPHLTQMAADLFGKKVIRLGYDQLFPACEEAHFLKLEETKIYHQFLNQTVALEQISCFQGMLCGMMLCLSSAQGSNEGEKEGVDPFPQQPGNLIIFRPDLPFNLKNLFLHPNQRFYLMAYTQANALYRLEPKDPHTHILKQLGYVFNDKLMDKFHPIIYR